MNDKFHRFKIVSNGPTSRDTAVIEMDGRPLKGVTNIKIEMDVHDVNRIILTMYAGSLNAEVVGEDFVGAVVDEPSA